MADSARPLPEIASLGELIGLLGTGRKVYVRYSAGPEADAEQTSRDYESGLPLPGLAALDLEPPAWWSRPTADWLARQICKYDHLGARDSEQHAWLLAGRMVGRGPDNEPLLADVVALADIADELLTEARRRYRDRFEVGRSR